MDQIQLCVLAQMLHFVRNDLQHIHPDDSGQRVCGMAIAHFSHCCVALADDLEKDGKRLPSVVLDKVTVPEVTNAFVDCCEGGRIAESEDISSSSTTGVAGLLKVDPT